MYTIKELVQLTSELNVLYVEDDNELRSDVYSLLETIFNSVDMASDGVEALDCYAKRAYNIVITDINMPKMNGIEMVTEIRKINPEQKVIAVSGHSQSHIFIDIIKAGVQGFIIKPIIQNEFINAIYPVCKEAYNDILSHEISLELEDKKKNLEYKNQELSRYLKVIDKNVLTSSTDINGNITYVSEAFCRLSGYSKEELIGKKHNIFRDNTMSKDVYKELWKQLTNGQTWYGELRNLTKKGNVYWVEVTIEPVHMDDKTVGYTAIKYDITDKKIIEQLSITDVLTQLYNRRHFNNILKNEANRAKRTGSFFSFMIIDVDHFKLYNDSYGHFEGDQTLIKIASVLKDCTHRSSDFAFRIGGEEFGVVFSGLNKERSLELAKQIIESIEALKIEHSYNSVSTYVTASCGLVVQKGENIDDDEIIYKLADEALYLAKKSGRNQIKLGA